MKDKDRLLLYGWIKDFKENMGWSGAMIIPRNITKNISGQLITYPVEAAKGLRKTLLGAYKFKADNKN